ncbi:MAG: DUF2791 family P-loop domain-containing protein [bacterium]|nr:DUF2791 family P-loop domain-containing protein [bacterium]
MQIPLPEWLHLLQREYLDDFIPGGGSSIKVAVSARSMTADVRDAVLHTSAAGGYLTAFVDASQVRVHLVDQLFYAVSRQIDWEAEADGFMRRLLNANGILVEPGQPLDRLDIIAEANGREARELLSEINRLISNEVFINRLYCREFRTAMSMLCRGRINPQNVTPTDSELIMQWLLGEKCSLTALKKVQIFQRIGRHNARLLLASLSMWLHANGKAGLALVMDIDAVITDYPIGHNPVRYTTASLLDTYELLRQFIDDSDEMSYFLMVVIAGPAILEDPKRGMDRYLALKMRLVEDVHDRERSNPLNAMVRLQAACLSPEEVTV